MNLPAARALRRLAAALCLASSVLAATPPAAPLRVMSFNVRYATAPDGVIEGGDAGLEIRRVEDLEVERSGHRARDGHVDRG